MLPVNAAGIVVKSERRWLKATPTPVAILVLVTIIMNKGFEAAAAFRALVDDVQGVTDGEGDGMVALALVQAEAVVVMMDGIAPRPNMVEKCRNPLPPSTVVLVKEKEGGGSRASSIIVIVAVVIIVVEW